MPGLTASNSSQTWSDFPFTLERQNSIKRFLLPKEKYKSYGYRKEVFSPEELLHKYEAYCKRCNAFALKPDSGILNYQELLKCKVHPGKKMEKEKIWTCCRSTTVIYPGEPTGCQVFPRHDWNSDSQLPRGFWDLHPTPPYKPSANNRYRAARVAVSLDCEMGTNRFNQPELVKLTLIDLFSKEVLIDALVKPQAKIKNMLTFIHGITYKEILSAVNNSKALNGRDAARERIFEFVGPETMVFVHGGANDFLCLRWVHRAIVDTQEVESRIKRIGDNELADWLDDEGTGLEAMCRLRTGVRIRTGSGVHDSLEDAMACRELGVWYGNNLRGEISISDIDIDITPTETKETKREVATVKMQLPRLETQAWPCLGNSTATKSLANSKPPVAVPTWVRPPAISAPTPPVTPKLITDGQMWECRVCKVQIPEASKLAHRVERSHMDKLVLLVQKKGG
ncbi:hypothetical protein H072_7613 [Dactylellina haptotyla CBS 200.50]|uniref:Exonuclease domain-containing protein n=1 Tax=Dactylellina haptotyla (strain CBS 200.50) TaxID=1284197 RepID=S8BTP2_DACHA|nr:hypothetical protein H072_7613 [Dactylellina haptotyla CBS 200.50]